MGSTFGILMLLDSELKSEVITLAMLLLVPADNVADTLSLYTAQLFPSNAQCSDTPIILDVMSA